MKRQKQEIPEIDPKLYMGLLLDNGKARVLLWVNPKQKKWEVLDTIIHESVHAYQYFFDYASQIAVDREQQAYMIAHIATTLLKEYEDAVHEKREKGLQTGTGVGAQEEARTGETTGSSERGPLGSDEKGTGEEG